MYGFGGIIFKETNLTTDSIENKLSKLFNREIKVLDVDANSLNRQQHRVIQKFGDSYFLDNYLFAEKYLGKADPATINDKINQLYQDLDNPEDIIIFTSNEEHYSYHFKLMKQGVVIREKQQDMYDEGVVIKESGEPPEIEQRWLDSFSGYEELDEEMLEEGCIPEKVYSLDDYHEATESELTGAILACLMDELFGFDIFADWDGGELIGIS